MAFGDDTRSLLSRAVRRGHARRGDQEHTLVYLGMFDIPSRYMVGYPNAIRGFFLELEALVLHVDTRLDSDVARYLVDSPYFRSISFNQEVPFFTLDFQLDFHLSSFEDPQRDSGLGIVVRDYNRQIVYHYIHPPTAFRSESLPEKPERKPPKRDNPLRRQLIVD